jgi:hypothetical protein
MDIKKKTKKQWDGECGEREREKGAGPFFWGEKKIHLVAGRAGIKRIHVGDCGDARGE